MAQRLYNGTEGTVDLGQSQQQLLLVQVASSDTGASVTIDDNPAIEIPPNSDWEWVPKQRWYGTELTFVGSVFFFVEAL